MRLDQDKLRVRKAYLTLWLSQLESRGKFLHHGQKKASQLNALILPFNAASSAT